MTGVPPHTRVVALDLETTGLSQHYDSIVELAAVAWQDGGEIGHFEALVNPGRPIPPAATRVHGITNAMVRDMPPLAEVLPAFLAFCEADVIVAHNAPFDLGFIRTNCRRLGLNCVSGQVVDTCSLARRVLPGQRSYSLEALKYALGLGMGQDHRALQDARDCLGVYLYCQGLAEMGTAQVFPTRPALPDEFKLLGEAIAAGVTVMIEYRDISGKLTNREILPLAVDGGVVQAYCLLRHDTRRFHLERIKRVWQAS